jgi:activating signal cointegrator 1
VENRNWRTDYRGPLAIHSAAESAKSRVGDAQARELLLSLGIRVPEIAVTGAILGTVCLDGIERFSPMFETDPLAWGPWCWILKNPRPFTDPMPYRGLPGLWNFDF